MPRSLFRWLPPSAVASLVWTNLLWACQGVAVKLLEHELAPEAIALLPLYLATVVMGFWSLRRGKAERRQLLQTAWRFRYSLLVAGVGGQLVAQLGMTLGIAQSLAADAAVLNLLIPIFSTLLACFFLKEKLTVRRTVALLLGLSGTVLLSPSPVAPGLHATGNLLIVGGCLGSAFYNVYSKRLLDHFSELEILFFSYLAASVASAPFLLAIDRHGLARLFQLTSKGAVCFLFLAIFQYGLSMLFFLRALKKVDLIIASASMYLIPVLGIPLAKATLGEHLGMQGRVGVVLVLAGMLVILLQELENHPKVA